MNLLVSFLKYISNLLKTKTKSPLILIASHKILLLQMKKLNFKKIKVINLKKIKEYSFDNKSINLVNINYNQKVI